jgi:predicted RNA-binding Zn ribbon-like protein
MDLEGGGAQAPDGFLFDFSGGRLCLDFANTLDDRPTERRKDLLGSYSDLVSWAEQAGVITKAEAEALRKEAARRPEEAQAALGAARATREALFDVFLSYVNGRPPPDGALAALNASLPEALSALRVAAAGGAFEWRWSLDERGLHRILPPVIRDAALLLTSPDLSRVRLCESGTCDWLFLDQSRNKTRRWCDMTTCGNRAKARRHYERKKRASRTTPP